MKAAVVSSTALAEGITPRELMGDTSSLDHRIKTLESKIATLSKELKDLKTRRQGILDKAARLEAQGLVRPL